MPVTRHVADMVREAKAEIDEVSARDAMTLKDDPEVVLVDIRDVRELERDGAVPGARHAPRGMLEFWADPESPYHKPWFAEGKRLLLFCAAGGRSALAAKRLKDMGVPRVGHVDDGFAGWKEAGGPIEPYQRKR